MDITPGDDNEANKLNLSNSDDASTEDSTSNDATNVNGNNEGPLIIESHKKKPVDDEIENQKENNGDGLVIVDISQRIAKVDTDDSESADDLLNDAVFSKGRKRKASEMRSDDEMDGIKTADSTLDSSIVEQVDKDESMMDDSDLGGLPPKQTLGKGKRARIPNKRYSDILLSPNRNNGSSDSFASEFKDELGAASAATPPTSTMYNYRKGKTQQLEKKNPMYMRPFELGWKRELVYRANCDGPKKTTGDVYYYTPSGKKVRSMREISEIVAKSDELTTDNFVFIKEAVGVDDPEKEIIRDAKRPGGSKRFLNRIKSRVQSSRFSSSKTPKVTTGDLASDLKSLSKSSTKGLGFKIKAPSKKGKEPPKLDESIDTDDGSSKPSGSRKSARYINKSTSDSPAKTKHLVKLPTTTGTSNETREDSRFMTNYLQNVAVGYATLKHVFQYLKVQDLLSAGCVCTMWRDIGSDPLLWRTIRMKNSQIHSFEGLAKSMKKYNTMHLDMRKMMLPSGGDEIWDQFATLIKDVDSLRKIEFCRCTAAVVEQMSISNPLLEVINATAIKCESMSLDSFAKLHNISELRLKSTQGMRLTSNIDALTNLKKLKHLSLTSVRDLNSMSLEVIGELLDLESLELGEFSDFPETFGKEILSKLVKLEKLRLEKGQGNCHTFEILSAVKDMTKIEQLELVNFDIKAGFDKALGACKHVRKLMIIPTYISQSATTNHMVLGGVLRLQKSLSHFVWGVTLELLRVTELFIDQCEEPEKKKEKKKAGAGDSIPVLKPVPLLNEDDEIASAHEPPQVEILSLPNLQKLLLQSLPTTRVKILKIPFHATWRQSITDSGN